MSKIKSWCKHIPNALTILRFILIHHNGVIELTEEFCNMSNNAEVKEVANKILNEMKSDLIVINKYI